MDQSVCEVMVQVQDPLKQKSIIYANQEVEGWYLYHGD